METATFAAGCFWGVESVFEQVPGVVSTEVGYTGGTVDHPSYEQVCSHTTVDHPSYEQVCSHTTGHAEAVRVTFDPERVSYEQLLDVFWNNHNPTQLNRQGWDVGDNYRSAVFFHSREQEVAALRSKATLEASGRFRKPIVTQVVPAGTFWPAEDHHQKYYSRRGMAATCKL